MHNFKLRLYFDSVAARATASHGRGQIREARPLGNVRSSVVEANRPNQEFVRLCGGGSIARIGKCTGPGRGLDLISRRWRGNPIEIENSDCRIEGDRHWDGTR